MLIRQRILLAMLREAERPVSKIERTKWAFVARMESSMGRASSFYDFVPFHYGPYSFSLAREVDGLVDRNYAVASEDHWQLGTVVDDRALPAATQREAC